MKCLQTGHTSSEPSNQCSYADVGMHNGRHVQTFSREYWNVIRVRGREGVYIAGIGKCL